MSVSVSVSESLNISIKSVDSWHENRHISKGREKTTHTQFWYSYITCLVWKRERKRERVFVCIVCGIKDYQKTNRPNREREVTDWEKMKV